MGEEVVSAVCRFRRSLELNSIDDLQVYCPKEEPITRYVAIVNSSVAILLDLFHLCTQCQNIPNNNFHLLFIYLFPPCIAT